MTRTRHRTAALLLVALGLTACGGTEDTEQAAPAATEAGPTAADGDPTDEDDSPGDAIPTDPVPGLDDPPAADVPTEADPRFMTSLDTSAEVNGVDFRQYGTDVELTGYGYRACELAGTGLAFPGPLAAAVAGEMGAPDRVGELLTVSAIAILCPQFIQ